MKKAAEYRRHAEQCRVLARSIEGEHRRQLLQMAAHWESLASERDDLLSRYPEIGSRSDEPLETAKAG
jgi:hypothetical protein